MSAVTTIIGNTTGDIELRFTQSGKAVGSVTVAVSDRKKDPQSGEWVDGDTWFARCTLWGELAEHAANSIHKGTRVIGQGRISQRDWEDKDGNKRTSVEVTLDALGADLRYATVTVTRASSGAAQNRANPAVSSDPWANTSPGAETGAYGAHEDGAPF